MSRRRARGATRRRWIGGAIRRPGALHRQLGIPAGEVIPLHVLEDAATAPGKLGRRARLALNLRHNLPRTNRRGKPRHRRR